MLYGLRKLQSVEIISAALMPILLNHTEVSREFGRRRVIIQASQQFSE